MPTIYEVANLAGVSPKTAARILAGGSPTSRSREHVLGCARKLGYVRNQQAANLRTGRSRLIGVVVPFIDNPFYTKFLQEMHDALSAKSYQCLIACSFGQSENMLAAVKLFETYNVDGVVLDISEGILTPEIQERIQRLQRQSHPVVITGGQRHDLACDHLYLDNRTAMAKLVRHLVARGHRTFGFLGGLPQNLNIKNRLEGFKAALREAGAALEPEWISLGDPSLGSVNQRAHHLLRASPRPTALVTTSDMIAMVAMNVAHEKGLRMPQDLAVTGFDDVAQAGLVNPGLTTVRQPMRTMAVDIVELLLDRKASVRRPAREMRYEAELVIRGST